MSYLEKLKNLKTATQGTAKTAKRPFDSYDSTDSRHVSENDVAKESLQELLQEVGAYIRDGQALVFHPPLAGPDYDPKRWDAAIKLEEMFLTKQQEKAGTHE